MTEEGRFKIELEHLENYEFKVKFDWPDADDLLMDEPAPLGEYAGPNAARLVAAAAANCLGASLLFCLHKADVPAGALATTAGCSLVRSDRGRLRIGGLAVHITLDADIEASARLKRCLDLFEDFCVVTGSLREGIPVRVEVIDSAGRTLHSAE